MKKKAKLAKKSINKPLHSKPAAPAAEGRGDVSRHKLIEAGLEIFGLYGFEGASTRQLAAAAKVNIAAIPYYFGGKEGLYLAVIDHIIAFFKDGMGHIIGDITPALAKNLPHASYRLLLKQFIKGMTRFILDSSEERIHISRIVTREQLDPTPAFDVLYCDVIAPMHHTVSLLVSKLIGIPITDPTLKLRTQALIGQIIGFKSSRETVLRNMGWKDFGPKEIKIITEVLQFHIDAIIKAYQNEQADA